MPKAPSVPAHVSTHPTPSLPLLLLETTHQYGARVDGTQGDCHGRSAEAHHGDLPPLQPPDQSFDRTGLAPPACTWSARFGSGPSGVYRRVAVGGSAIAHLTVVVLAPALERAGVLLTTTLFRACTASNLLCLILPPCLTSRGRTRVCESAGRKVSCKPMGRRTNTNPQQRLIQALKPPQCQRPHRSLHTDPNNQHPLFPSSFLKPLTSTAQL